MSFQGSLKELPVPDIIQLVSVSGKTGAFTLRRGEETGVIYLKDGQMSHARVGEVTGEEAVYALAIWSTGEFVFTPGEESAENTIQKSNTSLLMEAARRFDEWRVLCKKIPGVDYVPALIARESPEPVTLSPQEWNLVTAIDGFRTVEDVALCLHLSSFETAKILYGLVTADLVRLRPGSGGSSPIETSRPVSRISGAAGFMDTPEPPAAPIGDEKKILMILCTRIKQEAEAALGESSVPGIERPYKLALAEIDRGRGIEAVRELILQTEKTISALRGPAMMKSFQDKMALVMQPKS
jgi:Domain of unknown function (DUF4388)